MVANTPEPAPKVVVVGGSGFVGRHVVEALAQSGKKVVNIDRRVPTRLARGEIAIASDVELSDWLDGVRLQAASAQAVVWLAASIRHSNTVDETASGDLRVMVESPLELLSCLDPPPESFVYMSSVQVYGRPRRLPVAEDHPTEPFTAYGIAKLLGEQVLRIACDRRGTAFSALRVAFVYGPGQHPDNVLPRFIARVRQGEPPVIHGSGAGLRDDVYVGDVADAVARALKHSARGAFNIASGRGHTLREVAEAVCRFGQPGLTPRFQETPSNWVDRWYTIEKARQAMGYEAATTFEKGLEHMWREEGGSP